MPRDVMPPPQEAPSGTAFVEGVVVSADLGRPVRRATVRLSPVVPGPPRSTTSDDVGRFRFEGVAAGQFLLAATKPGYLESTFGQRQPGSGRPGTPLSVSAGQRIERVALPIARGGVLAGTVADDGGEPAFGTEVQAFRFVWQRGNARCAWQGLLRRTIAGVFASARYRRAIPRHGLAGGKAGIFEDMGLLPKLGNAGDDVGRSHDASVRRIRRTRRSRATTRRCFTRAQHRARAQCD